MKTMFIAFCVASIGTAAHAGSIQLNNAQLDRIVAGQPSTGVQLTAEVRDGQNFFRSTSLFSSTNPSANTTGQCQQPDCGFLFSLGSAAADGVDELLEQQGLAGLFLGLQSSPASLAGGAFVDTASGSTRAVAVGPNGEAGAKVKGIPIVQNDYLSATIGYGRGKTTGNGQIDIDGVVLEGQGAGNGFAIETPTGDTILFAVAVAVDPNALTAGPQAN